MNSYLRPAAAILLVLACADGHYEFPNLKPAVYGVVAKTAAGQCAVSSAIDATDGSDIIVPMQMKDNALCSHAVEFAH